MLLRTWLPYDWTPRSEAYFVFPLAQGTPGKQCGLAATGVYQPSLRSPWLAATDWQPLYDKQGKRVCGQDTYRTSHCIGDYEKAFTLIIQRK
ncbi:hypothetical protein, partial [Thiolapillus sp.]|uniref:hypothetical protein n=1 Tax=Thiolapillus sp. TaxID=2017437 RepID=UPI003AF47F5D